MQYCNISTFRVPPMEPKGVLAQLTTYTSSICFRAAWSDLVSMETWLRVSSILIIKCTETSPVIFGQLMM